MTATSVTPAAARTSGTVTGAPRRWLRLEGGVLLAGALIAFSATGQPWWLVPVTILLTVKPGRSARAGQSSQAHQAFGLRGLGAHRPLGILGDYPERVIML